MVPRANDEIGESHHPAGGEADGLWKYSGRVSDFSRGIGHGDDELPVNPSDGKQERAADHESEYGTQGAAAQQPVVHHHQPANTDHGAPSEGEVVGGAQLAGEYAHGMNVEITGRKSFSHFA